MMSVVEGEVGDRRAQLADEPQVALARVRPPHRLQDPARARLERQVRVLAHGGALGHRGDHVAAEVLRVRAREADPVDPVDGVDRAQQLGEARADVAAVRVDVLAEQRHLADSLARPAARPRRGSRRGAARSRGRGRPGRCSRSRRSCSPSRPAPTPGSGARAAAGSRAANARSSPVPKRAARDAVAAGAEPVAEVRDRAGPERDVDVRVEREQPLALCLRVAAADGDDRPGPLALQLRGVPM